MADDAKTPAKDADKKPVEATKATSDVAKKEPAPRAAKEETKAHAKVSKNLQSIIDSVEKLTVLELAELVKALEDKFGVSAAAPMMMAGAPGGATGGAEAAPVEEKTEFDVVLTAPGANKIAAIKAVREINQNLGLKEAKDLVEATPKTLLEGAKKEDAEAAKKKLEDAGAQVELK